MVKQELLKVADVRAELALVAAEYVRRYHAKVDTSKARVELAKLRESGLGGSLNAKKLASIIDSTSEADPFGVRINIDKVINTLTKAKLILPDSIVVPWKAFFEILAKYNLACGPISAYEGIIPEENTRDVEKASHALSTSNIAFNDFLYLRRVRVGTDKLSKKELNMVVEYLRRFPYVPSQLEISDVLHNIVGKRLNVRATYDALMRNEWIIAAPVDTMTNNTTIELYSEYSEMKKRIIEDPIIFKASKIGAVIVTMWDKEAEDSMFDKYR
jgi:hypothetical protein